MSKKRSCFGKIWDCFKSIGSAIVLLLRTIFCCPPKDFSQIAIDGKLGEILPKVPKNCLDRNDPFGNLIFANKSGHYQCDAKGDLIFKNPQAIKKSYDFYSIFANSGPRDWHDNLIPIDEKKKALADLKLSAFEYLYYLFLTPKFTENMVKFQNQSRGRILRSILWAIGRRNPWDTTIFAQEKKFKETPKKELLKYAPGFCRLLNLDEKTIRNFVEKEQWHKLVLHVYTERKKVQ